MTTLLTGLRPTHPGEILREDVLPAVGRSKAEVARLLHVSRQTLYAILDEKQAITTPLALKLAKLTDTSPEMWLNLQQAYDLRRTASAMAAELEEIPTLAAA
jgi:addiction module HigA family antidote